MGGGGGRRGKYKHGFTLLLYLYDGVFISADVHSLQITARLYSSSLLT